MQAFEDSVGLGQEVVVPEAQDLEALGLQPGIALAISGAALMLAAIQLDHQPCLQANEVEDVAAIGMLTAEFSIMERTIAKN